VPLSLVGIYREGPEKRPYLLSVRLRLRARCPRPSPYRRVRIVARASLFLIDDSNFRIYFETAVTLPAPSARLVFPHDPFLSFSSSPLPSPPPPLSPATLPPVVVPSMRQAHVIIVAIPRETGVLLSSLSLSLSPGWKRGKRGEAAAAAAAAAVEGRPGRGNDFEIFVAVHKFEGGRYAYLNTEPSSLLSGSLPRGRLLLVRRLLLQRRRPRLVLPLRWILPHLFPRSSLLFFVLLFFFSGPDLHCLTSANKLSRGPPWADTIVIIVVSTRANRERGAGHQNHPPPPVPRVRRLGRLKFLSE